MISNRQEQNDAEDNTQAGDGGENSADENTQVDPQDVLQSKQQTGSRSDILPYDRIMDRLGNLAFSLRAHPDPRIH